MSSDDGLSGEDAARLIAGCAASRARNGRAHLIGLNGAQGSGKSTMARLVARSLAQEHRMSCAVLSLDDFYLERRERVRLGSEVHPLCATRGVPGTHDLPLMRRTLDALRDAGPQDVIPLPRFDKLADDREPRDQWSEQVGRPDLVLLEGWCVGVRRSDLPAWSGPINALEAQEDAAGEWFAWSFAALEHYEPLWDRIGLLVSIEVPDWENVIESRLKQESGLDSASGRQKMDRQAVTRFVQHYERYTRAMWAAMPDRADILLRRDRDYRFFPVE